MQEDKIHAAWREGQDPEFAVRLAREMVDSVVNSTLPIAIKIALIKEAAEPLLDAPGGNPMLLVRAMKAIAKENAFLERTSRTSSEERMRRRIEIAVLQARGLHCGGQSYYAFRACLATLTAIQNFADGREGLLSKMSNRPPNVCAESALAVLGITAASLRRADIAETSRSFWTNEIRELVMSYIPDLENPASAYLYPGTPSLVQFMFLLAEDGDPDDAPLIRALHKLDKLARPGDWRALGTVPLREVAVANWEGDHERSAAQSAMARQKLKEHQLVRHEAVVEERRYLRA